MSHMNDKRIKINCNRRTGSSKAVILLKLFYICALVVLCVVFALGLVGGYSDTAPNYKYMYGLHRGPPPHQFNITV